jgi:hypothetical protein
MMKITDKSGKYEFTAPDGDYRIHVKRHGEEWLTFEQGHKAILALMHEIEDLREKLRETEEYADSLDRQLHGE